jgi:hypothetical protein
LSSYSCSTSRICPSWPRPRVRLSPFLAHTYLVSNLFVLAHPAASCLSQRFIFHMCNPPSTTRRLNTFIPVNIMGTWYSIYHRHTYSLQHFFLCLPLTSEQTGWPRTFMSGTITTSFLTVVVPRNFLKYVSVCMYVAQYWQSLIFPSWKVFA